MSAHAAASPGPARIAPEAAPERISPLCNVVFLKTFGESPEPARGLANAVLRRLGIPELGEVESVKADAAEPGAVGLKSPHCDVVIVAGNQVVDLEAQRSKVNFDNKALFYAAKLLVSSTPKGDDGGYERLPQVVVIMLVEGRRLFDGPQMATACRLHWERDGGPVPGSDRIIVAAVELDKAREAYNAGVTEEVLSDELSAWAYVLSRGYRDQREVDEIMGSFPAIEDWARQYGVAIDDPAIKDKYEDYKEAVWEWNSIVATARRDGLAEGRAEGLAEGVDGMMRELRALGVDESVIERAVAAVAVPE